MRRGGGTVTFASGAPGVGFGPGGGQNTRTAFYSFSGAPIEGLFGGAQGEVRFQLRSPASFSQRTRTDAAEGQRTVFEMHDGSRRRFHFATDVARDRLVFWFQADGSEKQYYFVPAGTEDQLFGSRDRVAVRVGWNGSLATLYLNNQAVRSIAYARPAPNWAGASFSVGASDVHNYGGGYYASDDEVSNFEVLAGAPAVADTAPPTVSFTGPSPWAVVRGTIAVANAAADNLGVAGVQWMLDGAPMGTADTVAPFTTSWNTASVPDGPHTLAARAWDAAGNAAVATLSVTVANSPVDILAPTAPTGLAASAVTSSSATLSWTSAADNRSVSGYRLYRDGVRVLSSATLLFTDATLQPSTAYQYAVTAYDAGGNESLRSAPVTVTTASARARVLQVGPRREYDRPCEAIAAAQPGDVIEIDAGTYDGDVCMWRTPGLTLRGVGGRPRIRAAGRSYGGKATWVVAGADTTVENLEFSGARVPDGNGAGIRIEAQGLTVRRCRFVDNENGILAMSSLGGELLVEYSEFESNGRNDGLTHNMYISHVDKFTLRYSYSRYGRGGHLVKTRGKENHILYNRLTDETGSASYELDVSNGGRTFVIGNVFQQSAATENNKMIAYAREGATNPSQELYVVNNTFVSDRNGGAEFVFVDSRVTAPALLQNNVFFGAGERNRAVNQAGALQVSNCDGANPQFVNAAGRDYRLLPTSPCADIGTEPGFGGGISLRPEQEYVHTAKGRQRAAFGALDAGALERGN